MPDTELKLLVVVVGIRTDRQGVAKIVLECDSSQLAKAMLLGSMTEQLLDATFKESA